MRTLWADGVQIYECRKAADASFPAWVFVAPDAKLVDAGGMPMGHHYAGPTWEAPDGSKVVGVVKAKGGCTAARHDPLAAADHPQHRHGRRLRQHHVDPARGHRGRRDARHRLRHRHGGQAGRACRTRRSTRSTPRACKSRATRGLPGAGSVSGIGRGRGRHRSVEAGRSQTPPFARDCWGLAPAKPRGPKAWASAGGVVAIVRWRLAEARHLGYSACGSTAVTSISTLARDSISDLTSTALIATS